MNISTRFGECKFRVPAHMSDGAISARTNHLLSALSYPTLPTSYNCSQTRSHHAPPRARSCPRSTHRTRLGRRLEPQTQHPGVLLLRQDGPSVHFYATSPSSSFCCCCHCVEHEHEPHARIRPGMHPYPRRCLSSSTIPNLNQAIRPLPAEHPDGAQAHGTDDLVVAHRPDARHWLF